MVVPHTDLAGSGGGAPNGGGRSLGKENVKMSTREEEKVRAARSTWWLTGEVDPVARRPGPVHRWQVSESQTRGPQAVYLFSCTEFPDLFDRY